MAAGCPDKAILSIVSDTMTDTTRTLTTETIEAVLAMIDALNAEQQPSRATIGPEPTDLGAGGQVPPRTRCRRVRSAHTSCRPSGPTDVATWLGAPDRLDRARLPVRHTMASRYAWRHVAATRIPPTLRYRRQPLPAGKDGRARPVHRSHLYEGWPDSLPRRRSSGDPAGTCDRVPPRRSIPAVGDREPGRWRASSPCRRIPRADRIRVPQRVTPVQDVRGPAVARDRSGVRSSRRPAGWRPERVRVRCSPRRGGATSSGADRSGRRF